MPDFIALKKLSPSDLTFFEKLYRSKHKSGQKCINLNAAVLTDEFYGDLDAVASKTGGEIKVTLTIFGPGAAVAYTLTRKITKGKRKLRRDGIPQKIYRNWRLNGEFIYDPEGEVGRFDQLLDDDLAVLAFDGIAAPTDVTMILLTRSSSNDVALHEALAPLVAGKKTMISLSVEEIGRALASTNTQQSHPLQILAGNGDLAAEFEDLGLGGAAGPAILRKRRVARPVTSVELESAKRAAERTGAMGESLVDDYLSITPHFQSYIWESEANAIAPFDFTAVDSNGKFRIDVKSTRGKFDAEFHISYGELSAAKDSDVPYCIYRVYDLSDDGAYLRISCDIREFAVEVLSNHDGAMQKGVRADSFSVGVGALTWGDVIGLTVLEEDPDANN